MCFFCVYYFSRIEISICCFVTLFCLFVSKVHDLDGNLYSEDKTFEIYMDVLNEFKREYPLFIGAKFIYAKNKYTSIESVPWRYFETATQFHLKYPQLMVGFDLVGQEDKAPPLMSYAQHIVQLPDDLKLFFHAGETNWFGSVDENLVIDRFDFVSLVVVLLVFHWYLVLVLLFVVTF